MGKGQYPATSRSVRRILQTKIRELNSAVAAPDKTSASKYHCYAGADACAQKIYMKCELENAVMYLLYPADIIIHLKGHSA